MSSDVRSCALGLRVSTLSAWRKLFPLGLALGKPPENPSQVLSNSTITPGFFLFLTNGDPAGWLT